MTVAINLATPGLANRIKTYLSCLSRFDEVKTTKYADTYIFHNISLCSNEDLNQYPKFNDWRFYISDEELIHLKKYKYIDLLYDKTPKYFIDKYLKVIDKLIINKDMLEYVQDFVADWNGVIGLHIRSWYCGRSNWHDNKLFEDVIDSLDSSKKIFLCGDNKEVLDHFKKKYSDRIIIHKQEKYSHPHLAESGHNNSVQTNTDAFIDLLLLSKCSTIVGTYASTFTELAWWFSQCNSKVIIPEPLNVPTEFKEEIFVRK
jgi:hypothetical protein